MKDSWTVSLSSLDYLAAQQKIHMDKDLKKW